MTDTVSPLVEELLELAATGRPRPAIEYALGLLAGGLPAERLITEVLAATQREVGMLWQTNQWDVAAEHAATAVVDGVLGAVELRSPVPVIAPRGSVLVACVEGEFHSLPARMGAERLRLDGWDVTFLGASLPAHDLQRFAVQSDATVVVLSCTMSLHLPGAARCISALADVGLPAVAAGAGFGVTSARAMRLGASAWTGPSVNTSEVLEGPLPKAGRAPEPTFESTRLQLHGDDVVDACMTQMFEDLPVMRTYSDAQLASTRGDLAYIMRYLAVSLDLDEAGLFDEFVIWLVEVLNSRGVPNRVLPMSLDIVTETLERAGLVHAAATAQSGRDQLGSGDTHGSPRPARPQRT